MNLNSNAFSLIALLGAVFFAGMFLRGENMRKKTYQNQLDEIQSLHQEIMQKVDSINVSIQQRDSVLVSQIDSAYTYLDVLKEKGRVSDEKLEMLSGHIRQQRESLNENRALFRSAGKLSRSLNLSPSN